MLMIGLVRVFWSDTGLSFSYCTKAKSLTMIHTAAILAMSADGKLTDYSKEAPSSLSLKTNPRIIWRYRLLKLMRFCFGARNSLRALHGSSSMSVHSPDLICPIELSLTSLYKLSAPKVLRFRFKLSIFLPAYYSP
jgi:hypothetical protein